MAAKDCDSCALGSMAVAARGCSEVAVWLSRLSVSLDCGDDDIMIAFDDLIINSPSFSDSVTITSGSLALNDKELTFD